MNLLVLLGDSDDEVGVAGDAGAVAAQDAVAAGSTQQLAPGDVVVLIQPQGDVARTQHRLERVFSSTEDGDGLDGGDDATFVGIGPLVFVVVFLLLFFVFVVVVVVVVFFHFFLLFFSFFSFSFFTSSQKGRIHQRDGKEEQQEGGDGDADRSGSGCGGGDDNNMMGRTEATIVVTTTFIMMSIEVVVAFVSIMIWRGGWWRRY